MNNDFWNRLDRSTGADGCWEWTGFRNDSGYGIYGKPAKRAHRIAYELAKGPIPDGLEICHRCDNPPCCNPAHLWAGTHLQNFRDMAKKERSGLRKLTGEQVAAIRLDTRPLKQIAADYGMHFSAIAYAKRGGTWKHIETPPSGHGQRAKIDEAAVHAIRADTRSAARIGPDYGISPSQVQRIKQRLRWGHI